MAKTKQTMDTLRKKDSSALQTELQQVRLELQKARVNLAFGHLTKPTVIRELRKQIARIQTLLKTKEHSNA